MLLLVTVGTIYIVSSYYRNNICIVCSYYRVEICSSCYYRPHYVSGSSDKIGQLLCCGCVPLSGNEESLVVEDQSFLSIFLFTWTEGGCSWVNLVIIAYVT